MASDATPAKYPQKKVSEITSLATAQIIVLIRTLFHILSFIG
jgi:hypothetical protein